MELSAAGHFSGRTRRSNSAAVTKPKRIASSRNVVPLACAAFATWAALSYRFLGLGGNEHERALHQFADARFVGTYSDDAIVGKGDDGVASSRVDCIMQ